MPQSKIYVVFNQTRFLSALCLIRCNSKRKLNNASHIPHNYLPHILFLRMCGIPTPIIDRSFFKSQFPSRVVVRYSHHTPLQWAE